MNDKINRCENFFDDDLRIKEAMVKISDYKTYDSLTYSDVISKNLNNFKSMFNGMIRNISFGEDFKSDMNGFIDNIIEEFNEVPFDSKSLNDFYEKYISNMSSDLDNYLGKNFCGYYLGKGDAISKCHSINDLLHSIHHMAINDEELFNNIPVLGEKNLYSKSTGRDYGDKIRLVGKENSVAQEIFDSIPNDLDELDIGFTDILSLDDRVIMMIRDRGHALSIDIDTSDKDMAKINYFIPKLRSDDAAELLKSTMRDNGVNSFTINQYDRFAMGGFDLPKSDVANQLTRWHGFIDMVPTDTGLTKSTREPSNDLNDMLKDTNSVNETIKPKTI